MLLNFKTNPLKDQSKRYQYEWQIRIRNEFSSNNSFGKRGSRRRRRMLEEAKQSNWNSPWLESINKCHHRVTELPHHHVLYNHKLKRINPPRKMPLLQPIIVHWHHPIQTITDQNHTSIFKKIYSKKKIKTEIHNIMWKHIQGNNNKQWRMKGSEKLKVHMK